MRALVTGITGQDGPYLATLLLKKGYEVWATYRREATGRFYGIKYLGIEKNPRLHLVPMDLTEYESVRNVISSINPDEIYNLAAQSHVGASFKVPLATLLSTGLGVANLLEAVRALFPEGTAPKIYQAGTSELFGGNDGRNAIFAEGTPFHPRSPYACAKAYAHHMMVNYREAYNMFICNGILFNHESPLRGENFVTRKVTKKAAEIGLAIEEKRAFEPLEIGNIKASRDWGHAADYVRAIYMMLQHEHPSDYVIATGQNHTVEEMVETAFQAVGLHGQWVGESLEAKFILDVNGMPRVAALVNPDFFRPSDCTNLTGDATYARMEIGWKPEISFGDLIYEMVSVDYDRLLLER